MSLPVELSIGSDSINTITNKAKNSLRFIRRNVKSHNKQLKEAAYRTYMYVRPQVEYCSTIWHPWQKHLNTEQKWFKGQMQGMFKMTCLYTSSVTNMLRELKWSTLEQCRNQAWSLTQSELIGQCQATPHHLSDVRRGAPS